MKIDILPCMGRLKKNITLVTLNFNIQKALTIIKETIKNKFDACYQKNLSI